MVRERRLHPFHPRPVLALPLVKADGWHLKRYAILAADRDFDDRVATAATDEAVARLPVAGSLTDEGGNQGVAFQNVHFAQVAVVSPIFYWQWGSVLAHIDQMRAPWDQPTAFAGGAKEVVGCIWEMNIIHHEVDSWTRHMLRGDHSADKGLVAYLKDCAAS